MPSLPSFTTNFFQQEIFALSLVALLNNFREQLVGVFAMHTRLRTTELTQFAKRDAARRNVATVPAGVAG